MTIKEFVRFTLSDQEIRWHCKDLDSIACAKYNVASPFGLPFSRPIIGVMVKEVCQGRIIKNAGRTIDSTKMTKIATLISSKDEEDAEKTMTVREIKTKLQDLDENMELCVMDKCDSGKGWISSIINMLDGSKDTETDRQNMSINYKGKITDFLT